MRFSRYQLLLDIHDPSVVREAIRLSVAVMDSPGITAFQQLLYIQEIQKNVGPEYRDYWVFAVAITHTVVKIDSAAVLVKIGRRKLAGTLAEKTSPSGYSAKIKHLS